MNFKIRQLQISDLQQASFYQTLSALRPVKEMAESLAENIFNDCKTRGIETYVVLDGEEIVGTLRLLLEPKFYHQGRLAAHIEDVATRLDYQGKGVASTLIKYVLELCRERACYRVTLDCNDSLISFYQRFGFQVNNHNLRIDL